MKASGLIIYGPPRSIRGRLVNRIRRLFGFDEQDELYYVIGEWVPGLEGIDLDADTITIRWDKSGRAHFEPTRETRDESEWQE